MLLETIVKIIFRLLNDVCKHLLQITMSIILTLEAQRCRYYYRPYISFPNNIFIRLSPYLPTFTVTAYCCTSIVRARFTQKAVLTHLLKLTAEYKTGSLKPCIQ